MTAGMIHKMRRVRLLKKIARGLLLSTSAWLACSVTSSADLIGFPISGDSLLVDSLIYVDSSQPRLRVGGFTGPGVSTAMLESLPLEPGLAPSFSIGIRTEMEFTDPLYFLFEMEFTNRRLYSESTPPTAGGVLTQKFSFDYLQFPLLFQVQIPIGSTVKMTTGFGATPSVLLSSSRRLSDGFNDTLLAIEKGLEQFDFSLDIRTGAEFSLTEKTSLTLDLRYLHGMQNLLILAPGDDPRRWKARSLGVNIGWIYQIQHPIYRE